MKTKKIIFLSFMILIISTTGASAQGWLNKTLKKVDNISKKIDNELSKLDDGSKSMAEKEVTNSDYAGASIKCSNPNLDIQLESCIRDENLTILSYTIINKGSDVEINYLGRSSMPKGQTNTSIFDSEGNQYQWKDLAFGEERYNGTDWLAPVTLPEGLKIKCSVILENVSKAASHLQRVTIGGWDFYLQFSNVPIHISTAASFVLNKEGLDCLKYGMLFSKIPAQCTGLYDRFEKIVIEDEMDGNYNLYNFYLDKEKVASISEYENIISNITAYSSTISTPDGAYPGMPISELLLINGVEGSYNEGIGLTLNEYSIDFGGFESLTPHGGDAFNGAYQKGTDVRLSKACFKDNAKVISISKY